MKKSAIVGLGLLLAAGTWTAARAAEQEKSVTGEVVDTYCYASMGAKGASHRECGMTCAKKGIPVGLLEKGTNKLYVLLPSKDKGKIPDNVIEKMGETATITGHVYTTGGESFLTISSVK
jgi:hypothetical protein